MFEKLIAIEAVERNSCLPQNQTKQRQRHLREAGLLPNDPAGTTVNATPWTTDHISNLLLSTIAPNGSRVPQDVQAMSVFSFCREQHGGQDPEAIERIKAYRQRTIEKADTIGTIMQKLLLAPEAAQQVQAIEYSHVAPVLFIEWRDPGETGARPTSNRVLTAYTENGQDLERDLFSEGKHANIYSYYSRGLRSGIDTEALLNVIHYLNSHMKKAQHWRAEPFSDLSKASAKRTSHTSKRVSESNSTGSKFQVYKDESRHVEPDTSPPAT